MQWPSMDVIWHGHNTPVCWSPTALAIQTRGIRRWAYGSGKVHCRALPHVPQLESNLREAELSECRDAPDRVLLVVMRPEQTRSGDQVGIPLCVAITSLWALGTSRVSGGELAPTLGLGRLGPAWCWLPATAPRCTLKNATMGH